MIISLVCGNRGILGGHVLTSGFDSNGVTDCGVKEKVGRFPANFAWLR